MDAETNTESNGRPAREQVLRATAQERKEILDRYVPLGRSQDTPTLTLCGTDQHGNWHCLHLP